MKGNIIRWMIAVLMLAVLGFLMVSPAAAEVTPLPLDHLAPGNKPLKEGWSYLDDKEAVEGMLVPWYAAKKREWSLSDIPMEPVGRAWERYEDESISMEVTYFSVRPARKEVIIPCIAVHVKIADPTQIRTAMSYDTYQNQEFVHAEVMAKHVNAIAATGGDFFKYHYDLGYVVRQGVFYRNALNGRRDLLLIDNKGDFHGIKFADDDNVLPYIEEMEKNGLQVINTFNLGPVLVENGEAVIIEESAPAQVGEFSWYSSQQRVAICQLGELEYVIFETGGHTNGTQGMTLQELADLIVYMYPDCKLAYNLDGGGSTNVIVNGERIHITHGRRKIGDILYFASAYTESENHAD